MSITTQYVDATRKVQDNWFAAFDALSSQYLRVLERPVTIAPFSGGDVASTIDQVFDYAAKSIDVQREAAHRVLAANVEFASQWRAQAEAMQSAWVDQAKTATEVTREQMEHLSNTTREQVATIGEQVEKSAEQVKGVAEQQVEAAAEQTKRNYNLMNSAQLKAELAARELAQSGSLEEMRNRLKDADKKA